MIFNYTRLVGLNYAGYPGSKGAGGSGGAEASGSGRKMKPSQFNFTRPQPGGAAGHLSQISEDGAFPPGLVGDRAGESSSSGGGAAAARSFSGGFSIVGPWEESRDIIATLGAYDSQFSGAMAGTALEMAGMDRYMQLQPDQMPFKVRAKRGCATHPRSIAERERRTRISEKLRKLQELVPHMDKVTSTPSKTSLSIAFMIVVQKLSHAHRSIACTPISRVLITRVLPSQITIRFDFSRYRACLGLLRFRFCNSASKSSCQTLPAPTILTPEKKVDLRINSKAFMELLRGCSKNIDFVPQYH
uniref:BHLH domain-containing protein n=1 Tax=Setaria viridis TaxID=4556 RepID=A0A4U6WCD7_SETVI|nr:hypothetical protein SEVIR_1G227600v2 [Setaria viridis]